ncbi:MAG TPA: hypothetical protein VIQ48_15790 [Rhodanobacter sp.]|jgi:hypothetical protein
MKELTVNEMTIASGGSIAMDLAIGWSSTVEGAGIGLVLGGPVGGLIGAGVGFVGGAIAAIGYELATE